MLTFFFFFGMHFISQGNTEEIVEANSVDSAIQQVVGSGGQRVITIVTDGVPLGTLQTAVPTSSLSQPFIVTMEDGQQGTEEPSLESCRAALRINFKKKKAPVAVNLTEPREEGCLCGLACQQCGITNRSPPDCRAPGGVKMLAGLMSVVKLASGLFAV